MSEAKFPGSTSAIPVWWVTGEANGYIGAGNEGIEFRRHDNAFCKPGMWSVGVTGWRMRSNAVVDDFGSLVPVGVMQ